MKKFILFLAIAFSFVNLLIISPSYSEGLGYYWIGESGLLNDPLNWSLTPGGTGGAGVPGIDDWVWIESSDGIDRIIDSTGFAGTAGLNVNANGTGTITLLVPEGSIGGGYYLNIGWNTPPMNIIVNQSGGRVYSGDQVAIANTLYNISGGYLLGGEHLAISNTTVNQSGGEVNSTSHSIINTTYNLFGGLLRVHNYIIVDGGTFNHTGGIVGGASVIMLSGTYNLSGTGEITSYNGLANSGLFNYTGGAISGEEFYNRGTVTLSGSGTRVVEGNIENNGIWKTTQTIAEYNGTFTNNGAYISDPATQYFNDLIVAETGYLVGQHNDEFYISGDFINNSNMSDDWNTMHAYLGFIDGTDNLHDFYITGTDFGATMSGYANNFSWGILDITDEDITLFDGNDESSAAFYLRELWGAEITLDLIISNLTGFEGLNIYYLPHLAGNSYLSGLTYNLSGGGWLRPVPEPATMLLLGSGFLGLVGVRRKLKKK